jgi:DNA modification methylase
MHEDGTELVDDIIPKSPIDTLKSNLPTNDELRKTCDAGLAAAVLGMNRAFIARALEREGTRPKTLTIGEVVDLLDVDGFQETFVPRSKIPRYLMDAGGSEATLSLDAGDDVAIVRGNARDLVRQLAPGSVQCVVTSSPYWGMRVYENTRPVMWADEEHCAYGFEQTPEGFIRHTIEILHFLKPAITASGSVWWNVMDTYNTRTPIRMNARERVDEMGGVPETRRGWTEHAACRHSAGHMYLNDAEQSSIPARIAERASRIGYRLKMSVTWRKSSATPEPVRSRGTRQAEYVLHLGVGDTPPLFNKAAWRDLALELGGPHPTLESPKRVTDVWSLPTSTGKNGHGAEFPLALPGRCIALASAEGDLVLDPFIGSGTTALAAMRQGRRCLGFDISDHYVQLAERRVAEQRERQRQADLQAAARAAQMQLQDDAPEGKLVAPAALTEDRVQAKAPARAVVRAGARRQQRELARASPIP